MVDFAVSVIEQIGIWGAGLLIALETIVMPIPSEVVLLLSGFNSSIGNFDFFAVVVVTTLGSLLGALTLYAAGYFFGEDRLRNLIARFGKYVGIYAKDFNKTMIWFERHGAPLVLFGRLIPIIRSLVSIPAGLTSMSLGKFVALTALGSGIWNTIWISLGLVLGANWHIAEQYSVIIDYVAYGLIAILAVALIIRFVRASLVLSRRRNRR